MMVGGFAYYLCLALLSCGFLYLSNVFYFYLEDVLQDSVFFSLLSCLHYFHFLICAGFVVLRVGGLLGYLSGIFCILFCLLSSWFVINLSILWKGAVFVSVLKAYLPYVSFFCLMGSLCLFLFRFLIYKGFGDSYYVQFLFFAFLVSGGFLNCSLFDLCRFVLVSGWDFGNFPYILLFLFLVGFLHMVFFFYLYLSLEEIGKFSEFMKLCPLELDFCITSYICFCCWVFLVVSLKFFI